MVGAVWNLVKVSCVNKLPPYFFSLLAKDAKSNESLLLTMILHEIIVCDLVAYTSSSLVLHAQAPLSRCFNGRAPPALASPLPPSKSQICTNNVNSHLGILSLRQEVWFTHFLDPVVKRNNVCYPSSHSLVNFQLKSSTNLNGNWELTQVSIFTQNKRVQYTRSWKRLQT